MKVQFISTIMSVYDGQKYIAQAIESILTQTFADFEFIIIDDGSTDNSLKMIRKYAQKDDRTRIVLNENNIALAESLN